MDGTQTVTKTETTSVASDKAPVVSEPKIDVAAITKQVTEEAVKAAESIADKRSSELAAKKLAEVGRALTGEQVKSQEEQIVEKFVTDPAKLLHGVKELAKKEMREEMAEVDTIRNIQREVGQKYVNEYPGINTPKRLEMVESLTNKYVNTGMGYQEALDKSFKDTVSEFKIESVSEAQKSGNYPIGFPGGGGVNPGAPKFSNEKSQSDFLSGMKAKAASFRTKKAS